MSEKEKGIGDRNSNCLGKKQLDIVQCGFQGCYLAVYVISGESGLVCEEIKLVRCCGFEVIKASNL